MVIADIKSTSRAKLDFPLHIATITDITDIMAFTSNTSRAKRDWQDYLVDRFRDLDGISRALARISKSCCHCCVELFKDVGRSCTIVVLEGCPRLLVEVVPGTHPLLQATLACPKIPSDFKHVLPTRHRGRQCHRGPRGHHHQHREEQSDEAACAVDAMLAVHQYVLPLCKAHGAQLEQVLRALHPAVGLLDGQDLPSAGREAIYDQVCIVLPALETNEDARRP